MYDIDVKFENEAGASVDDFLRELVHVNAGLNESWARIKAGLPTGEQAAAEVKVREVLKA